jgi:integrase
MKIGGYDMARDKYHHLYKRGKTWHFRKGGVRFSLETTVATEAMRVRDRLLEDYRIYGQFRLRPKEEDRPTFGHVVKEWAKIHSKKVKYSTWRDYKSSTNLHILPAFKDMLIDDITYLDVEQFRADLDCGAKRSNNILVPMRSVFKMAHKQGYVRENIMLKVDNLSVDQPNVFPFTEDEVLLILEAADPFYRPYTCARFQTGMRSGEIDGLEWIDYKEKMTPRPKLHVNKAFVYGQEGKPKTKKSKRYVDCLPSVVKALEAQRKLTGNGKYIFVTKDGDRMNPDHFRNVVWKPALEKAGLEYRAPIQTRHTFATISLSKGEDIGWVQNMLGHSSLQMIFTRYYAWMPKETRNDGAALIEAFDEAESRQLADAEIHSAETRGKVIPLFGKTSTKMTHHEKGAHNADL